MAVLPGKYIGLRCTYANRLDRETSALFCFGIYILGITNKLTVPPPAIDECDAPQPLVLLTLQHNRLPLL